MHRWRGSQPVPDEQCFEAIKAGIDAVPDGTKMLLNSGEFYANDLGTGNLELLARFFDKYPSYADKTFLSVKVRREKCLVVPHDLQRWLWNTRAGSPCVVRTRHQRTSGAVSITSMLPSVGRRSWTYLSVRVGIRRSPSRRRSGRSPVSLKKANSTTLACRNVGRIR